MLEPIVSLILMVVTCIEWLFTVRLPLTDSIDVSLGSIIIYFALLSFSLTFLNIMLNKKGHFSNVRD